MVPGKRRVVKVVDDDVASAKTPYVRNEAHAFVGDAMAGSALDIQSLEVGDSTKRENEWVRGDSDAC